VEKLVHHFLHRAEDKAHRQQVLQAMASPEADLAALEREKIRGAIRTDFILSAEIIVIALGVIGGLDLVTQLSVLAAVAVMMTVGVYGLVAIIVKLDDLGLLLRRQPGAGVLPAVQRGLGGGILWAAPWLMRGLSVAGTVAMFLVGGGILSHGLPPVHHAIEAATADMVGVAGALLPSVLDGLVGIVAGVVVLLVVSIATRLLHPRTEAA
jgi:predicted DNA repair protein MutK